MRELNSPRHLVSAPSRLNAGRRIVRGHEIEYVVYFSGLLVCERKPSQHRALWLSMIVMVCVSQRLLNAVKASNHSSPSNFTEFQTFSDVAFTASWSGS